MAMYKTSGGVLSNPAKWVVELLDFDRCTGKMSNLKTIDLRAQIPQTDNLSWGRSTCAFSPSGENLFITIGAYLFEYNLKTASYYKIWDTIPTSNFVQNSIKLAPNGKLYIGYQSLDTNAAFIGVVHQPDSFGPSCGFVQHGYYPVNNVVGFFPNTTNYNLGAVPLAENKRVYKDTICEGDPYERSIDSFAHTRYSWYDSQGTLLTNTRHIRLQPRADAVYSIHLQDSTVSCSDRWDTLYLHVKPLPCVPDTPDTLLKIALPTAFTPNGDGQNETFYPLATKAIKVTRLAIYNRWGQLVHDVSIPWDGRYRGEPQPEGAYWYVVEIGGELRKGVVTLMR
jgi:gliding motility-associated-like protein